MSRFTMLLAVFTLVLAFALPSDARPPRCDLPWVCTGYNPTTKCTCPYPSNEVVTCGTIPECPGPFRTGEPDFFASLASQVQEAQLEITEPVEPAEAEAVVEPSEPAAD